MFLPTVYILASKPYGSLYIGVTSNVVERLYQHQVGIGSKHTAKYNIKTLVWMEHFETMADAIQREKSLKRWYRQWKTDLINEHNPNWYPMDAETGEFIIDDGRDPWDGSPLDNT